MQRSVSSVAGAGAGLGRGRARGRTMRYSRRALEVAVWDLVTAARSRPRDRRPGSSEAGWLLLLSRLVRPLSAAEGNCLRCSLWVMGGLNSSLRPYLRGWPLLDVEAGLVPRTVHQHRHRGSE